MVQWYTFLSDPAWLLMTKYPISYSDNQGTWPMFCVHISIMTMIMTQPHTPIIVSIVILSLIIFVLLTFKHSTQVTTSGSDNKITITSSSRSQIVSKLEIEREILMISRDSGLKRFQIAMKYYWSLDDSNFNQQNIFIHQSILFYDGGTLQQMIIKTSL